MTDFLLIAIFMAILFVVIKLSPPRRSILGW